MDVVSQILAKTSDTTAPHKAITVDKHLEVNCDLGGLLVFDTNELDKRLLSTRDAQDDYLLKLTRDNTQLLLNQVWQLPTERYEETIVVQLPKQKFALPRAKPVPKPRAPTKWQQFAKAKGIEKKKKSKLSWDEQLQKWVPRYGFRKSAAEREREWVLEVPQNGNPMEDQFAKRKIAKGERVAKNELQRLRNLARARKVKIPRVGIPNPDVSTAKELQAAVTVAKASTASLGKFQDKLPKEKEARGVTDVTPGASRKRKLAPVSAADEKKHNLTIADSVLNKKPKLTVEKIAPQKPKTQKKQKPQKQQQQQQGQKRKRRGK